jgi:hypothetical protein
VVRLAGDNREGTGTLRRLDTIFALALAVGAAASAQAEGVVRKFLRDQVSIYDKDGNFVGKRPKWTLPARGAAVVARNGKQQLGINDGSAIVYLRSAEIETEGVQGDCMDMATAGRAGGRSIAASEGVGSGMSGSAAPCIPK